MVPLADEPIGAPGGLRRRPGLRPRAGRRHARRRDRRPRRRRHPRRGARRRVAGGARRADADVGARDRLLRPRARHRPLRPAERRRPRRCWRATCWPATSRTGELPPVGATATSARRSRAAERGRSYVAIQAFVTPTRRHRGAPAGGPRGSIRDALRRRDPMGFGPRYLHSTGQLHKGGSPTGRLPAGAGRPSSDDLPIPGRPYGFRDADRRAGRGDARRCARPAGRWRASRLGDVAAAVDAALGRPREHRPSRRPTRCATTSAWPTCPARAPSSSSAASATWPAASSCRRSTTCYLRRLLPAGFAMIGIGRTDPGGDDGLPQGAAQALRGALAHAGHRRRVGRLRASSLNYVTGTFDDAATYDELQQRLAEVEASHGTGGNALFYLSTPPSQFPVIVRRPRRRRARDRGGGQAWRRIVIEKPFGRRPASSAQALDADVHEAFREAPGLPHRPLPGQGDGPEHPRVPLRQRHLRAALEPQLHRPRADHGGRVDRRRGPRPLLRGGRRAARHGAEPHAAGALASWRWSRPARSTPRRCATSAARRSRPCGRCGRRDVVRGQYDRRLVDGKPVPRLPRGGGRRARLRAPRPTSRRACASTTGAGPARRSTCAPASGCRSASPRSRSSSSACRTCRSRTRRPSSSSRTCSCCASSRTRASRCASAPRCRRTRMQIRTVNMDFEYDTSLLVGRPPRPTRRCCSTRMRGDATNFPRQDAVERVVADRASRCSTPGRTTAARPHLYPAGTWGPEAADELLARDRRRWRRP